MNNGCMPECKNGVTITVRMIMCLKDTKHEFLSDLSKKSFIGVGGWGWA